MFREILQLKNRSRIKDFDSEYKKALSSITTILDENKTCTPLFICVVGSSAYGLDLPESDIDIKGIYIQDLYDILKEPKLGDSKSIIYKPQLDKISKDSSNVKNDTCLYELGRFIDLLKDNNPNILELLSIPEECIIYKHEIWDDLVKDIKDSNILTKLCYYTFYNYALQQINKATGLNKKINNPIDIKRKTPIDFCNVIYDDGNTLPLRVYLDKNKYDQKLCGLSKINNARDMYLLYYDTLADESFSRFRSEDERSKSLEYKMLSTSPIALGYKGIIKENDSNDEVSNTIRISSIPVNENRLVFLSYNKDGYMVYCKSYKEYWGDNGWIKKRNENRYNDNIKSGQNYDGKNMSHCIRLLNVAINILDNNEIITKVNESERDYLLKIKKGESSYNEIIDISTKLSEELKIKFEASRLPERVDYNKLMDILYKYRIKLYGL